MKMSLTLTGTASQLAAVLASLPHDVQPEPIAVPSLPVAAPPPLPVPLPADSDDNGAVDASAPALDVEGLPWDARIHGKTKTRNQDGSWRKRRGVDDAAVAAVEAELRARLSPPMPVPVEVPVAPPMPVEVPVAVVPVAPPMPVEVAPVPVAPPMPTTIPEPAVVAPVAPPMPVAEVPVSSPPPAAPPPEATPEHLDFTQFMQHLSGQMTKRDAAGTPLINTDVLAAYAAEISTAFITAGHIAEPLKAITDIATNQGMIDYAVALLTRDGRW